MTITLYDLTAAEDRRFSPFCWRVRMALAHKGLAFEAVPVRFTEIDALSEGDRLTLPTIEDGGRRVTDSWDIAEYLEERHPDAPTLFPEGAGRNATRFIAEWTSAALHSRIASFVLMDIHDCLDEEDAAFLRRTREARFGKTLEEFVAGREERVGEFRKMAVVPLRRCLGLTPFLAGEEPAFADYAVFGAFQWARAVSDFRLVEDDDPIAAWLDRMRSLFGGAGDEGMGPR